MSLDWNRDLYPVDVFRERKRDAGDTRSGILFSGKQEREARGDGGDDDSGKRGRDSRLVMIAGDDAVLLFSASSPLFPCSSSPSSFLSLSSPLLLPRDSPPRVTRHAKRTPVDPLVRRVFQTHERRCSRSRSKGGGKESKFTCIIFIDHQIMSHS